MCFFGHARSMATICESLMMAVLMPSSLLRSKSTPICALLHWLSALQLVACNKDESGNRFHKDKRRPFSSSQSGSLRFRARLLLLYKPPLHRSPVRSWLVLHTTSHAEIISASAGTRFSRIAASNPLRCS